MLWWTGLLALAVVIVGLATGASLPIEATEEPSEPVVTTSTPTAEPLPVTVQAPEPEPEPKPTEAPESEYVLYDVPLSVELQEYTQDVCKEYGVSYPLVLAIMKKESQYQVDAISDTDDYGIMQVNECNHEWLAGEFGFSVPEGHELYEAFLDPKQNILAGVYILSQCVQYEDLNKVLMAYNRGPSGAKELWNEGVYSLPYSLEVIENLNGLEVMSLG